MSVMIQVRHVDESVHRKLKARAAMSGMSLSDYLRKEIQNIAARPSKEEIMDRLARLTPVKPRVPSAAAVRAERNRR